MPPNRNTQAGGILVYVLIGVVLFGMLMYAYTRSGNSTSSMASKGTAKAIASSMIDYTISVDTAVKKVMQRGCSENEITFEDSRRTGTFNVNPNAPADKHCHIYDIAGGNVKDPVLTSDMTSSSSKIWKFSAHGQFVQTSSTAYGTNATELIIALEKVPDNVCLEINKQLGLPWNSIPTNAYALNLSFCGNPANASCNYVAAGIGAYVGCSSSTTSPVLTNICPPPSACMKSSNSSYQNFFYKIMLIR